MANKNDVSFEQFEKICHKIKAESSHLNKTAILKDFLTNGKDESKKKLINLDIYLFLKLLLPSVSTRVYNLNNKQPRAHISDLVVIDLFEYKSTISGDLYESVVYLDKFYLH